jgi:hypothetical protein
LALNGVLFFSAAYSNGALFYRLTHSAYLSIHKTVIILMFALLSMMVFMLLWILIHDRYFFGWLLFLLILISWVVSINLKANSDD